MIDLLNQGWVGSVFGILGALVGVVGIVLYRNSRIGARPTCQMKSLHLIGKTEQELPDEVEILFEGKAVPSLSSTMLYLWNAGKQTVRGNQIVGDDPLRFELRPQDRILKALVATRTRAVNKVQVTTPEDMQNKTFISFDYLDPGDGARIDILHTREFDKSKVLGSIRGIPKGVQTISRLESSGTFNRYLSIFLRKTKYYLYIITILGSVSVLLSVLPSSWIAPVINILDSSSNGDSTSYSDSRIGFFVVGFLYLIIPLMFALNRRKRYPSMLDKTKEDTDCISGMTKD